MTPGARRVVCTMLAIVVAAMGSSAAASAPAPDGQGPGAPPAAGSGRRPVPAAPRPDPASEGGADGEPPAPPSKHGAIDLPLFAGRLALVVGTVQVRPGDGSSAEAARRNRPVGAGDALVLGPGAKVELQAGAMVLRLAGPGELQLLALDDRGLEVRLVAGRAQARARVLPPGHRLLVLLPPGAARLTSPGSLTAGVDGDTGNAQVAVREGRGQLDYPMGTRPLGAGEALAWRAGTLPTAEASRQVAAGDAFDDWCAARDSRGEGRQALARLGYGTVGYEDLDAWGSWESAQPYGDLWVPRRLAQDWAPFRSGHWAYVAPWGWTWIDDAPWGFAPFHYGRWVTWRGAWAWAPLAIGAMAAPPYLPATVGFVGLGGGWGGNASWYPLGYDQPYWPPGQFGDDYFTRVNGAPPSAFRPLPPGWPPPGATSVPRGVFAGGQPVWGAQLRPPPTAWGGARPAPRPAWVGGGWGTPMLPRPGRPGAPPPATFQPPPGFGGHGLPRHHFR